MSNNHNVLHCVNIRPKCLAVRTDSRTDGNELILKSMPYQHQLQSKCHDTIVHETGLIVVNTQVQSHALLRRVFGTSVNSY